MIYNILSPIYSSFLKNPLFYQKYDKNIMSTCYEPNVVF